jgi:hypothetical protein
MRSHTSAAHSPLLAREGRTPALRGGGTGNEGKVPDQHRKGQAAYPDIHHHAGSVGAQPLRGESEGRPLRFLVEKKAERASPPDRKGVARAAFDAPTQSTTPLSTQP